MPGTAIGTSLNLGYVGKISRNVDNIVTAKNVKSILDGNGAETMVAVPFGFAVVANTDGTVSKFGASGSGVASATAANFGGFAVAEIKQMTTYGNVSGAGQYEPNQKCDVIQRGTINAICKEGTPTANGKVYIMTVAGTYAAVGELVATASPSGGGATAVELTNARWTTGKVDANNVSEITIIARASA